MLAVITILLGIALILAACEGLLRWIRPDMVPSNQLSSIADQFIGWRYLPGQEIEYPMAAVILGGLLTSTLLNVFLLPPIYAKYGKSRITEESGLG